MSGADSSATGSVAEPSRRLFIAVPLATDVVEVIGNLVSGIRERVPGADTVRWVRMDGLHLTVRFLGRALDEAIPPVAALVEEMAGATAHFTVSLTGGGAFPSIARPRALWLGVGRGAGELADLAHALDPGLADLGWPREERPFRAHLTLARSDGVKAGAAVARELRAVAGELMVESPVDRLVLFESVTGGGPARYLPLHVAQFAR